MKSILIATLLSSTTANPEPPKEPIVQAVHCSVYALVASAHIPSDRLKDEWRHESTEWSKEAFRAGASDQEYFLTSETGFEIFDEMMEGERLGVASYLYRTEGCTNGRTYN